MRPCICDRCGKGQAFANGDCRVCWLYHNDERYRLLYDDKPQAPGLLKKAATFGKAIVRHALNMGRNVSDDEHARRLEICKGCEFFKGNNCLKCGCGVLRKAKWASEKCPIDKW